MARRIVLVLLVLAAPSLCDASSAADDVLMARARAAGWSYLIDRLAADGVPRAQAAQLFSDPRMEPFTGLEFGLAPREPRSTYRHFLHPSSIAQARDCRARYASAFEKAEREHGVSASVVAAILHVESGCGRNTGSMVVLYRVARLAMANEPGNLAANTARLAAEHPEGPVAVDARVRARAKYLEDTFYPEVRATLVLADRLGIDPLALRGSSAGAFGYPQFLPTSYLKHGVDGDGDGRVSLYDPDDAIVSTASYLAAYGWRPGITAATRRATIWRYNHSDAYVDAVLALAEYIDGRAMPVQARRPARQGRHQARARKKVRRAGAVPGSRVVRSGRATVA